MITTRTQSMKAAVIVVIGFLIAGAGLTTASATQGHSPHEETCVPVDAVAYQPAVYKTVHHDAVMGMGYDRYSWTPGRHSNAEDAPDVTGSTPSTDAEHWQLDQKPDPKGDPIGVAFKKGHSEDASWFFWFGAQKVITAAYDERVLVTPEVPAVQGVTCPGSQPEIVTEWYTWDAGAWTPNATNASNTHWPQTLVGMGQIAPTKCETTYQQDKYVGTRAAIDAVIADGVLTNIGLPEDFLIVKQWAFVSTGACPPVLEEVTPAAPTAIVICGADNDGVTIPTTEGVTYSDTGWVEGERTITAVADKGYTLLGTTSWTFTDEATACPIELTAVAASVIDPPICGPNNDEINIPDEVGVTYSDTGWVDGERTITATADEGYILEGPSSWTFYDEATACPIELTAAAASVIDPPVCGPNNDVVDIPTTEGITYSDTGWVDNERTITATADEGYILEGQSSWTFFDQAVPCEAFPPPPTVVAKCFPNNDTVTIPEVEGVIYADTGWVDGKRTITASPAGESTFFEDVSWTFTDVPSAGCAPAGPAFAADELAFTGASGNSGGLVTLAILFIAGGTALVTRKVRSV